MLGAIKYDGEIYCMKLKNISEDYLQVGGMFNDLEAYISMELLSVLAMENIRFWRNKKYMAGINVPQYEIFKIGTDKLKYSKWNLNIDKKEAFNTKNLFHYLKVSNFELWQRKS